MTSHVWGRDPQEAYEEPYEYDVQAQFAREARRVLQLLYRSLNTPVHRYDLQGTSPQKAAWLLAMDALDALRECLECLERKRHRLAGRLFRDASETMDLAAFFHSGSVKSKKRLMDWYADGFVPHREYRDQVEKNLGADEAKRLAKYYSSLSRFTHRSYRVILQGYSRGAEDRLVHDRTAELYGDHEGSSDSLVLPETIAAYYAMLSAMILEFAEALPRLDLASRGAVGRCFRKGLESNTIPRRFLPRRWLMRRLGAVDRGGPQAGEPPAAAGGEGP